MKKVLFIIVGALFVLSTQNAQAGKNDIIEGGPFIMTGAFLPSSNYYFPNAIDNPTSFKFTGITFQFGHSFLMADVAPVDILMRATWVELAGGIDNNDATDAYVFHGSIIKLGPQLSFKLSEESALDGWVQVAPTVSVLGEFGNSDGVSAVGLTSSFGGAFRYKKLILGAEVAGGRLLDNDARGSGPYSGWTDAQKEFVRYRSSNVKIMVGLQFGKG